MANIPVREHIHSYADALERLGGRGRVQLRGTATVLRMIAFPPRADDGPHGDIDVLYHGTAIVTYHADGTVTLRTGGYMTATTKFKLNAYGPVCVWQNAHTWYLGARAAFGAGHVTRVQWFGDDVRVENVPDASGAWRIAQ